MAFSAHIYTGDGVKTEFVVNFTLGYLSTDHVICTVEGEVDGLGDPIPRTLTWITAGLVDIGAAPANGLVVTIRRDTPKDALIHDYSDGAVQKEQNLDESNLQNIMLAHEILDGYSITRTFDLDMNEFNIVDLKDPVNPQDAATKSYVDLISAQDQVDLATAQANIAIANAALTADDVVLTNADAVSTGEDVIAAAGSASDASDFADAASASADLAEAWYNLFGGKNYIINGSFAVAQEGLSFVTSSGTPKWTLDMHKVRSVGGSCTVTQLDNPLLGTKSKKGLRFTGAATITDLRKWVRIESIDAALLRKDMVYSIRIHNSSGSTINPFIKVNTADVADDFSAVTNAGTSPTLEILNGAIGTLEFTLNLGGTVEARRGIELELVLINGGSFASGTIDIAEEQFQAGTSKTEFDHEHTALTLQKCERYWQSSYDLGVAPGTVTNIGMLNESLDIIGNGTHKVTLGFQYSPMRKIPTLALYSPNTGASGKIYDFATTTDLTASTTFVGQKAAAVHATQASAALAYNFRVQYTLDARLD